jgi:hypothetical protein
MKMARKKKTEGGDGSYVDTRSSYEKALCKKLEAAKMLRSRLETEWRKVEQSLIDNGDGDILSRSVAGSSGTNHAVPESEEDARNLFQGLNLNARNAALIHSQLISNIPAMMATPHNKKDRTDREAAQGHEIALEHINEEQNLPCEIGIAMVGLTHYGTAIIKQVFDKSVGAYESDHKGNVRPAGKTIVTTPSNWDIWLDPDAKSITKINCVFERLYFSYDVAKDFFSEEALHMLCKVAAGMAYTSGGEVPDFFSEAVEVYEYWEAGSAADRYKGRLVYMTEAGHILKELDNPCRFNMFPKSKTTKPVRVARLPYTFMPYEIIKNYPYGRTPAARCVKAQATLNQIAAVMIQTGKNVGVPHVMTSGTVINKDSLTDNSACVIQLDLGAGGPEGSGSNFPAVMQAASTSQDMKILMEEMKTHINDQWGINDALLGKQGRETQGVTLQVSIQQANLIREWLFDNYVRFLKDVYKVSLSYAVQNWSEDKWKLVLGEEDSQTILKSSRNADVEGGYSIHLERNMLIALDPISRQEQLMRFLPLVQNGMIEYRFWMKQFKFADWRGLYSKYEAADNRAKKNIETIIKDSVLPVIYKHEDHIGIAAYVQEFINSFEFDMLSDVQKKLVNDLIDKRMELEAQKSRGTIQAPKPNQQLGV